MVSVDIEPAGVSVYLAITTGSIIAAYFTHPVLLVTADWLLDLGSEVDVAQSVNFFFTLVAVVYGIIVGSTLSICYERQVSLVAELYKEILILEHLLQCTLVDVADPELRKRVAAAVRRYVNEEICNPHRKAVDSPFAFDSSFNELVQAITAVSEGGCSTTSLVAWSRKLAGAQSDRSTVMALVLPVFHWVFMIALQFLFLICFLVFDAASGIEASTITAERKFNFSGLVGTLVLIQLVLFDLNNPVGGLYSFQAKLDERLAYAVLILDNLETQPAGWAPEEVVQLQKLGFTSPGNNN